MKLLPLIWRNLQRNRLRSFLTLLTIMTAFVLFGLLAGIRQALLGGVHLEQADRLVVRHKLSLTQLLPESYKARLEHIPGVAAATHQTRFGGIYQEPKNFFFQSPVLPEEFLAMRPELILPAKQKRAWLRTRTGAIVGRKTAERFHWKLGDKIPLRSTLWEQANGTRNWEFDLVGIFDGKDSTVDTTGLYFHYDYFDEARPYLKGEVGWYLLRVKDPAQAARIAKRVDREFENAPVEIKTEPEGAYLQACANQVGNIALITAAIAGAVCFVLLLVIGTTMAQSVRERTRELGMLKAIGFTHGRVLWLVLGESCALTLAGGLLGLGLAWLGIARGDPTGGMLPGFHLPLRDLESGIGLSVALGIVTGIIPALRGLRLETAAALRST